MTFQIFTILSQAQPGEGAKGAEVHPLARSKMRKKIKVLIFNRFRAYNPIKMLLQIHHIFPVI